MVEFLNRVGPWLLLVAGVSALLQSFFLHQFYVRWFERFLDTEFVKERMHENPSAQRWAEKAKWSLASSSMRLVNLLFALLMIAGGVTWLLRR